MIVLGIIIVLVVLIIGYFISTQRELVNLDELCKNALSQIEVQLNSRFDAVIALAKTAAQYAKHESETIIQAVQARGGNLGNASTPAAINEQASLLGQMMSKLNVVFERYPELKASDLYKEAQEGDHVRVKGYEEYDAVIVKVLKYYGYNGRTWNYEVHIFHPAATIQGTKDEKELSPA